MEISSSSAQLVGNTKKPSYITQYIGTFSACMGAMCFGIALGYSSPAGAMLTDRPENDTDNGNLTDKLYLTDDQNDWFSSTVNVGAFVGGPVGGLLINNIGRRGTMLLSVVTFMAAWILTIFGQNFAMLIASRIIVGLSTGITCIAANTYVGELASVDIRGALGSGFQLMVVMGIEYAYIFGAIVHSWRTLAVICAIPPILYFGLMLLAKESPVYLLSKRKETEAEASLQYFRGEDYDVQKELERMREAVEEARVNKTSVRDLVNSYLLKPLLISLGLMFFQQFSGVNAVLFNLTSIFRDAQAGLSENVSAILVGFVQIVATAASTFLIERTGRKILLIGSSVVMAISLVALGVFFYVKENGDISSLTWLPLVSLILFITSFSIGYGPIPWLMMSELFPRSVAGEASSLSTMMNWSMSFVCTLIFNPLRLAIHDYGVYWFFAAICVVNVAFCVIIVPETKGKTIEEISAYFGAPTSPAENTTATKSGKTTDISTIS